MSSFVTLEKSFYFSAFLKYDMRLNLPNLPRFLLRIKYSNCVKVLKIEQAQVLRKYKKQISDTVCFLLFVRTA